MYDMLHFPIYSIIGTWIVFKETWSSCIKQVIFNWFFSSSCCPFRFWGNPASLSQVKIFARILSLDWMVCYQHIHQIHVLLIIFLNIHIFLSRLARASQCQVYHVSKSRQYFWILRKTFVQVDLVIPHYRGYLFLGWLIFVILRAL